MIVIQIANVDSLQCGGCGWEQERLYSGGRTEDIAWSLFNQNGGLCAECFLTEVFQTGLTEVKVHAALN